MSDEIEMYEGHTEGHTKGHRRLVFDKVRTIKQSAIRACRFTILLPSHYRDDGTCKCSNREHRAMMIKEWGYRPRQFDGVPLVD